ncbi:WD40 repeat domain-containing protein [Paraburkholderia sp. J63]|uniref:WD40 repeat domain-containing protein n=1 Tax=Paraburkholderia sp. J63 TaxID=2805434 RepID=UPI002ABD592A|nr:WD40 repeat domain-containing protein [Paraburkholderia sp. J63]
MLNFADAAASNIHPFIGLRPFRIEDAAFFFGRERQIATLLHLVRSGALVSVVGSSGSGKSSLVRAGLLPALTPGETRETLWDWVDMRPGESPVRNLAEALARPNVGAGAATSDALAESKADRIEIMLRSSSFGIGEVLASTYVRNRTRLLIVIDQFEEIFRYANLRTRHNINPTRASELRDEATFFVQLLLAAAADDQFSGAIVLTMRSDFIGDCARFQGLSEAVTKTQYLVPALTRDQRALAIRGPVERAEATIEPALVQRVLNDTNEDPDQLPVLQHAMMRCCQRAQDHDRSSPPAFTLERYNEIGGIEGALTQHGDELLASLAQPGEAPGGQDLQHIAKRIFQSLTEIESQGRIIRRPQTIGDLVKVIARDDAPADEVSEIEAAVRKVVAHFADPMCSFLRAPTEDTLSANAVVDIGHEALIRRWERLGGDDPASWVRQERDDAEKYNRLVTLADLDALPPPLLREFETWWQQRQPNSFWASRYARGGENRLDAAADLLSRSRAELARRQAEAVQRRSRRRKTVMGSAAAVCAAVILAAGIYVNRVHNDRENLGGMQADQIASAGLNLLKRDSADQAALLAENALSRDQVKNPVTWPPLQKILMWPPLANLVAGFERENSVDWLPLKPENMVLAYDALQHMQERAVLSAQSGMIGVFFKPAGGSKNDELVTVSWSAGGDPWVWNVDPVWGTGASRMTRSNLLLSAGQLSAFQLSINKNGDAIVSGPTVSANGISLVSSSASKQWTRTEDIKVDGARPRFGVFAPDRDLMLTGGNGTRWAMWALSRPYHGGALNLTRKPAYVFADIAPASSLFPAAAISGAGKFVAIAANDGPIQIFEVKDNGRDWPLAKELVDPRQLKPDTGGNRAQDQDSGLQAHAVKWLMFDPGNPDRLIGTYDQADYVDIWSVTSRNITTLETGSKLPIFRGAISPDGKLVAATIQDQSRIYVWKLDSPDYAPGGREAPLVLRGNPDDGPFISVAFDNQDRIAAGTTNGKVSLWYPAPALSRELPADPPGVPSPARAETACAGGSPETTQVTRTPEGVAWVVRSEIKGVTEGSLKPKGTGIIACKVSDDGKWLLLTPSQGPLELYDLHYLDSPVGIFGAAGAKWSGAGFAENPDRIVARPQAGALQQWQFFRDKSRLLAFINQNLPLVWSGGNLKPAGLKPATRDLVEGRFWSLMDASENEALPLQERRHDDK